MKYIKNVIIVCLQITSVMFFLSCSRTSEVYIDTKEDSMQTEEVEETVSEKKEQLEIIVYVCGAVKNPGVYSLNTNSRIYEAINLAGGLLENADLNSVNQAELLKDEQMIYIYTIDEERDNATYLESDTRIDLNTADKNILMTLPGIGAAKAEAILVYRQEHGKFSSIEDLKNVSGIKEGTFEQIKEFVKVRN